MTEARRRGKRPFAPLKHYNWPQIGRLFTLTIRGCMSSLLVAGRLFELAWEVGEVGHGRSGGTAEFTVDGRAGTACLTLSFVPERKLFKPAPKLTDLAGDDGGW